MILFKLSFWIWGLGVAHADVSSRLPQNLHLVDRDPATGFEVYRASQPNAEDMLRFCRLGITEMMVLSGNGQLDERLAKVYCPTLKVVYNQKTSARSPLTPEFLEAFDAWVLTSHAQGKKIAFRCFCGCHRTGRLAAYYLMRFRGVPAEEAIADMKEKGKVMFLYPELNAQVRALSDFIQGQECSEKPRHCVRSSQQRAMLEFL